MEIIWSRRALNSYFKVVDYLKDNWGESVLIDFLNLTEKVIRQIKEKPKSFQSSRRYKNVRKGYITKHNALYYRIKPRRKEIELLLFWDNRRDSKKLKY